MVKTIKNNLHKFLILGMLLLSFCLFFAGCNLTNKTPSSISTETKTKPVTKPSIAQDLVEISKNEYETIPSSQKPTLYNESGSKIATSLNWENKYYIYSPFKECSPGEYILSINLEDQDTEQIRGYVFGVYNGSMASVDYSKFTNLTSLKQTNPSGYYSYDVTNFINNNGIYTFYAQALGKGYELSENGQKTNYLDSEKSQICTFYKFGKLNNFDIELQGFNVVWPMVDNAKEYEVYISLDNLNFSKKYTTSDKTTCDLEKIDGFTIPTGEFYVKVKAVGKDFYVSSESEAVEVSNIINLSVPTDLQVDNSFVARWDAVNNATKYELTLVLPNGTTEIISSDYNSYNLSSKITTVGVGQYFLKVKAVGDVNEDGTIPEDATVFSSLYSDYVPFVKTATLSEPTNLQLAYKNNNVDISWNAVANAQSYSIYLKVDENYIILNSFCEAVSYSISLNNVIRSLILEGKFEEGEKFESFTISVKANGYDYYLESNYTEETINNQELQQPTNIKVLGKNLVWDSVPFAEYYIVNIANSEGNNLLSKQTKYTFVDLSLVENLTKTNNISIVAASDIYLNSAAAEYVYTIQTQLEPIKLDTFKMELASENISFTWQAVEDAKSYSLYVDLNQSILQEEVMLLSESENVICLSNNITETTFSISHTDLQQKLENKKYSQYYFYIVANGDGYFKESAKTPFVYENTKLSTPVLSQNGTKIEWHLINNAIKYKVYILNDESEYECINDNVTATYLDIYSYLTETALYKFKVEAVSNFYLNSEAIIEINFNKGKLANPFVYIVGSEVKWNSVENADYYELYINSELKQDSITTTSVNLSDYCTEIGAYEIGIKAYSNSKDPSDITTVIYRVGDNAALTISIDEANSNVSFNNLQYATSYDIYLNNTVVDTIAKPAGEAVTYNYLSALNNFKLGYTGDVIKLTVAATESGLLAKNYSNSEFVYKQNAGATEFYYVFDTYYDNYIESRQELVFASLYSFVFNKAVNLVINYDYAEANISGLLNGMYNTDTGTKEVGKFLTTYSYRVYWDNVTTNSCTLWFESKYKDNKDYSTGYTKPENNELWTNYQPENNRGDGLAQTENLALTAEINNSDALYWAIEFGLRPTFTGTEASQRCLGYYERAKQILNEILPENATDYEKALIIAEYIMQNSSYDDNYNTEQTKLDENRFRARFHFLEGFFEDGLVVCDGYAKIYSLLCNMEGIKTYTISGLSDKTDSKSGHAWNKIYLDIDGEGSAYVPNWYMVDLTWCDGSTLKGKEIFDHDYFLLYDNHELIDERSIDSSWYPKAETIFNYYTSTYNKLGVSLHASSYEGTGEQQLINMLETVISAMLDKGETCIDLKYSESLDYYIDSAIQTAVSKIETERSVDINIDEDDYSLFYTDSANTLLILTISVN